MKSSRNKTIDISRDEGKEYFNRAIKLENPVEIDEVINKSIHGDNLKIMDYLPENSVDLIVTDPPYNLSKDFHDLKYREKKKSEYIEYTNEWLSKAIRLLKDTGSIYICCDWKSSSMIESCLDEYADIRNRITWQREKGRGAKTNWKNSIEDIWYATMSDNFTFNIDDVMLKRAVIAPYKVNGKAKDWEEEDGEKYRLTYPSNFWDDITIPFWSMKENTAHPTQKSEKLFAKLILASSNEGDIVFDPFLGSGTSSVVAKKLNRKYIGIEQSDLYITWAEKRLKLADEDKNIQGYDGVFWERNSEINRRNR